MQYEIQLNSTGIAELEVLRTADSDPASWGLWLAVGMGDPDEPDVVTPNPLQTELYLPVACKKLDWVGYIDETYLSWQHIMYSSTPTEKLYIVIKFPSYLAPKAYIREMALYIDGNCKQHTGTPIAIINHSKIWWDRDAQFQREFVITLSAP